MLGNHETGVLQPVAELAAICNQAGIPMHTDAVQVAGKLPVSFRALGVAAMSVAAHKFGGPAGIGALIVRDGVAASAADVRRASAVGAAAGHRIGRPGRRHGHRPGACRRSGSKNTPGD